MSYDGPPPPPPGVPPPPPLPYNGPIVPPAPLYPSSSGSTTVLVLGIIGLVGNVLSCCCCLGLIPALCAPVAWWMGARELRAIREGMASPHGEGSARAGMICGMVGTGIIALYVLVMMVYVAVVGFAAATETLKQGNIPVR